ncbi:hypothetical protein PY650_30440 [Rhizobium calliandrae]|uniref:Uncharacterized protein n=1 Tax=Rhizobium calliandrae TaxID=1312182 RepID=A0ABT7KPI7_9HYPH|nr:hypothetical protein [Rhizobium calliandrae]MDL2409863.1 hypothetical protein [Rhizobium calliandrae]
MKGRMLLIAGLSALIATSALAARLTRDSTLADWESSRKEDQVALAKDMLARTAARDLGKTADLLTCIEKVAREPAHATIPIRKIASPCLVLIGAE